MHRDYALILILLGAVVPLLGRWRVERILRGPETTQTDRLRLYASTIAFQWTLVAVIFWRTASHGMAPANLGLAASQPVRILITAAVLLALVVANQLLSLRMVGTKPEELHGKLAQVALRIFPQDGLERLIFFVVVATVAICEELIYRGFVQALFQGMSGSAFVGILVSACWFSFAHLYQGRRGLIATFVVGLLFSMARFASGSLIPGIAAHFATDLIAGYMFPSRLRAALTREAGAHPIAER